MGTWDYSFTPILGFLGRCPSKQRDNEKRKVIYVFGFRGFPFIGGGAERHSENLYPRLVKLGYDVTVLTRRLMFEKYEGVDFSKVPYINNMYFETLSHSFLASLETFRDKPNIVHIHNLPAFFMTPFLKLRGIKVILTIHSLNYLQPKWGKFARFVLNTCEKIGVWFAHEVITVSRELKSRLEQKYNKPITFIPNGVNPPEYTHPNFILKKYDLRPKKYILAVGRLVPEKNYERLIEAYRMIPEPEYKLVIVGDCPHQSRFSLELRNKGSKNIKLTGFLCGKELAELYTNAGLFVSASLSEGFPLVVLEALSYGLPVLVSDIPAHREIQLPKERYFDKHDTLDLAAKMRELIYIGVKKEEKEKYQKILKDHYDWDAITRATAEVYER